MARCPGRCRQFVTDSFENLVVSFLGNWGRICVNLPGGRALYAVSVRRLTALHSELERSLRPLSPFAILQLRFALRQALGAMPPDNGI